MGHRANLVVIEGPNPELYYSQWRASSLDADLFWGPSHATAFVRSQTPQRDSFVLLGVDWAEGGAVIDHGRRTVLWYGGHDIRFDVPRRRLHLALMGTLWPGWTVRWAGEGVAEIADYLNVPRHAVMGAPPPPPIGTSWAFEEPQDPSWNSTIVSSVRGGKVGLIATDCSVVELLNVGSPLLQAVRTAASRCMLDWSECSTQFATGGVHLDWEERSLCYWIAEDAPALSERARAHFADWSLTAWGDRYEAQLSAVGGALRLPVPDSRELLENLQAYLLGNAPDFSDPVSSIVNRLEDSDGIIAPMDARMTRGTPPEQERRRLLASVVPPRSTL